MVHIKKILIKKEWIGENKQISSVEAFQIIYLDNLPSRRMLVLSRSTDKKAEDGTKRNIFSQHQEETLQWRNLTTLPYPGDQGQQQQQ